MFQKNRVTPESVEAKVSRLSQLKVAGAPTPCALRGEPGDIAGLTTRLPGTPKADRFIFAIYRIGGHRVSPKHGHWLESDGSMEIRIPDELLSEVRYWDQAEGDPDWRPIPLPTSTLTTKRLLSDVIIAPSRVLSRSWALDHRFRS